MHDVTNKIIWRDSNYIVDVVMRPKFDNCNIYMGGAIITLMLYEFDQNKQFFKGCSWFNINNLTVCYYHVTYMFQSQFTPYNCLNVKELLARNKRDIWILSDSNGIRTHNHLICKRTLNHLTKLAKWLSCVVTTFLYGTFDSMLLSCHVLVSEWIYTA